MPSFDLKNNSENQQYSPPPINSPQPRIETRIVEGEKEDGDEDEDRDEFGEEEKLENLPIPPFPLPTPVLSKDFVSSLSPTSTTSTTFTTTSTSIHQEFSQVSNFSRVHDSFKEDEPHHEESQNNSGVQPGNCLILNLPPTQPERRFLLIFIYIILYYFCIISFASQLIDLL